MLVNKCTLLTVIVICSLPSSILKEDIDKLFILHRQNENLAKVISTHYPTYVHIFVSTTLSAFIKDHDLISVMQK